MDPVAETSNSASLQRLPSSPGDEAAPRTSNGQLLKRRAQVIATRQEGRDALRLDVLVEGPWTHRPGQVAELTVQPGAAGFFAIASADDGARLTFLVRAGGSLSEPIMSLPVGSEILVGGPFGRGFELDARGSEPRPLLLVGVGSALGALRAPLIDALSSHKHRPITLVLGVKTPADVAFADELRAWRDQGVAVHIVSSRAGDGLRGHVQDHLPAIAAANLDALVLLAGSEELEDEVTALLVEAGIAANQIQRNFRPDGRG